MTVRALKINKLCNSLIIGLAIIAILGMNKLCYASEERVIVSEDSSLNSLENIPTKSFGFKMLLIYNSTNSVVSNISFPDKSKLPTDISYADRTTCILDGTLQLKPNENCILILKYAPKIEGVNSSLPITISGFISNERLIALIDESVPYSSRITSQIQPGTQVVANSQIGITLTDLNPESNSYGRDSLENVRVGYFGLKMYTVTNTSSMNLYAVTFPIMLPRGFSYDTTRTTCSRLDNKLMLKPGESCNIFIKYMPVNNNDNGTLPFQIAGVDDYYTVVTNNIINIPYSSLRN